MMRIAMFGQRHSIHTVRWANALAKRGHEVHLISATAHGEPLHPEVHFHKLAIPGRAGYFLNLLQARSVLKRLKPSVINTHFASGYGTLVRLTAQGPNVLSVWGSDVYDFPEKSALHHSIIVKNLRAATWICSTSEVMARQVENLTLVAGLTVVPFGIDTEMFQPRNKPEERKTLTIGTVKTLSNKYGIDLLIRAFAQARQLVADRDPSLFSRLRLKIVGTGDAELELRELARTLGIEAAVEFTGFVPHHHVPAQLQSFDIYVALSRLESESFGVAVLEASAVELPVVVSDVGGLPEVVSDAETGLVVPSEAVPAAAAALLQLIEDPLLRVRMGRAGRNRVVREYSWDSCVSRLEAVLQQHAVGIP